MSQKNLSQETRQQAELQFAEIVGRLHACENLENGAEQADDPRVLYGWSMLMHEVLIRLAEATLKLIYQLYFDDKPPYGHSLKALWNKIPKDAQEEIKAERGESLSFTEYDGGTFQDVRYSAERLKGGKTIVFEMRRLYLDSLAAMSVAKDWLGEVTTWPWAGVMGMALAGYQVLPLADDRFEVWITDPIEPMDWAGATITTKDGLYVWTLYFGFVDKNSERKGYKLPAMFYPWPMQELFTSSLVECVEQIYRAYQEPAPALLEARRGKWPGVAV